MQIFISIYTGQKLLRKQMVFIFLRRFLATVSLFSHFCFHANRSHAYVEISAEALQVAGSVVDGS